MRKETDRKRIMLVNDMPGYGKVALAAMTPVLANMGHYIFQLPTAMISNTLDFGRFQIQDMTEYMKATLNVWAELDFEHDCICTGFVLSKEQAELLSNMIAEKRQGKVKLVLVDPIMGDGGRLYNGIDQERVEAMRRLVSVSDVMVPNLTEAAFLTGRGLHDGSAVEVGSSAEIRSLIDGLHEISGRSVVITSVVEKETGRHLVAGYDHWREKYFEVEYEYLPVRVAGSGDIFAAILTGSLLDGQSLCEGAKKATSILHELILRNEGSWDSYKGIPIEQFWEVFDGDYGDKDGR